VPIITFVYKLDREGREPFDLTDGIEQSFVLDASPASCAIGVGRYSLGIYDLFSDLLLFVQARCVHDLRESRACGVRPSAGHFRSRSTAAFSKSGAAGEFVIGIGIRAAQIRRGRRASGIIGPFAIEHPDRGIGERPAHRLAGVADTECKVMFREQAREHLCSTRTQAIPGIPET
jgi:hypothetical protein